MLTRNLAACVVWVCICICLSCPVLDAHEAPQDGVRSPAERPRSPAERPGFERPAILSTDNVRRVFFEVRLAEGEPVRGLTSEGTVKNSGKKIHLHNTTVVTNGDVVKATVLEVSGRYDVAITLSPEGAAKMMSATSRHVGRPLAIILDGDVVAVLTVRKALGGDVVCSGGFTRTEATKIAAGLEKW
jgi:hypothetical protein